VTNDDFEHRHFPSWGGSFRGCAAIESGQNSVDRG
jgi:hypothetical protein